MSLARYEAGLCECGFHESLTGDRSNHFTFEVKKCPVCKGAAQFSRMQAEDDERERKLLGENAPAKMPREADGRRTYARMMSAAEVEQRRANGPG